MALDLEALGRERPEITRAAMDVEHPLAVQALEVMVVGTVRKLVARSLAREIDRHQDTVLDE